MISRLRPVFGLLLVLCFTGKLHAQVINKICKNCTYSGGFHSEIFKLNGRWILPAYISWDRFGSFATSGQMSNTVFLPFYSDGRIKIVNENQTEILVGYMSETEGKSALARTDGTPEGTFPIWSGDIYLNNITKLRNTIFFISMDGILYKSDGTPNGTTALARIDVNSEYGRIRFLHVSDSLVWIYGNDEANGSEIWVSDGTVEGTYILANMSRGNTDSYARLYSQKINGKFIIEAYDSLIIKQYWITDGTSKNTKVFRPDSFDFSSEFISLNGNYYFFCDDRDYLSWYKLDSTNFSAELISRIPLERNIGLIQEFIKVVNNRVFFVIGQDDYNVRPLEIWVSDGTSTGTRRLSDKHFRRRGLYEFLPTTTDGKRLHLFLADTDLAARVNLYVTDGEDIKLVKPAEASLDFMDCIVMHYGLTGAQTVIYGFDRQNDSIGKTYIVDHKSDSCFTLKYMLDSTLNYRPVFIDQNVTYFSASTPPSGLWKLDTTGNVSKMTFDCQKNPETWFIHGSIIENKVLLISVNDSYEPDLWGMDLTQQCVDDILAPQVFLNPNPAQTEVMVNYGESYQKVLDIAIFDGLGRLVFSRRAEVQAHENQIKLDISGFAPGIYFVRARIDNKVRMEKLMIR